MTALCLRAVAECQPQALDGAHRCTTNAIASVSARIRRAVKARGRVPNEQATLKCVKMAIMPFDPTGKGEARRAMRWRTALNVFDRTFDGRVSAARQ